LAIVLIAAHLGAGVLLFVMPLPATVQALVVIALLASLCQTLVQHAWRYGPWAVRALRLHDDEGLLLQFGDEDTWRSVAIRSRFVHRRLLLLSLRIGRRGWPTALVIAFDAIEPDAFRRLRAALLAPPRSPAA